MRPVDDRTPLATLAGILANEMEAQFRATSGPALERAGVRVAFHTDDWVTDSRLFLRMAALAVRAGLPREQALESVTLAGAEMLDLSDRIGSLTVGKDMVRVVPAPSSLRTSSAAFGSVTLMMTWPAPWSVIRV